MLEVKKQSDNKLCILHLINHVQVNKKNVTLRIRDVWRPSVFVHDEQHGCSL